MGLSFLVFYSKFPFPREKNFFGLGGGPPETPPPATSAAVDRHIPEEGKAEEVMAAEAEEEEGKAEAEAEAEAAGGGPPAPPPLRWISTALIGVDHGVAHCRAQGTRDGPSAGTGRGQGLPRIPLCAAESTVKDVLKALEVCTSAAPLPPAAARAAVGGRGWHARQRPQQWDSTGPPAERVALTANARSTVPTPTEQHCPRPGDVWEGGRVTPPPPPPPGRPAYAQPLSP